MKKYVWSETVVEGGKPFSGKLAHPPDNTGAFQNMAIHEEFGPPAASPPKFYADVAVVAFRVPPGNANEAADGVKITSSGAGMDPAILSDGDLEKTTSIPIPTEAADSWIQFEYSSPHTVRALTYVTKEPGFIEQMMLHMGVPKKALEASDDGQNFHEVVSLTGGRAAEQTISVAPVTAKFFRITFKHNPPPPIPAWAEGIDPASFGPLPPVPTSYEVAELVLHSDPRVNHFEEKAAFVPEDDLYKYATPAVDRAVAISKSDVIDLTSKMQTDGTLEWTPPAGNWVVTGGTGAYAGLHAEGSSTGSADLASGAIEITHSGSAHFE
jgi:hypothetical protein